MAKENDVFRGNLNASLIITPKPSEPKQAQAATLSPTARGYRHQAINRPRRLLFGKDITV